MDGAWLPDELCNTSGLTRLGFGAGRRTPRRLAVTHWRPVTRDDRAQPDTPRRRHMMWSEVQL